MNRQIQMMVDKYLALPYPITLTPDETGGYVATVPLLPGCISDGETADEAVANIRDAMALHIESMLEDGEVVPVPEVSS